MQNFTHEEMQPSPSTILFLKQFARMYSSKRTQNNGYVSFPIVARC